jgi:hypothetical protein
VVWRSRDDADDVRGTNSHDLASSPRRPVSAGTDASSRNPHRAQLQLHPPSSHHQHDRRAAEADAAHRSRLDPDTRLRRRVHEMLLLGSRSSLRRLDGLPVGEARCAEVMRRDKVWERLVALGVLRRSEGEGAVRHGAVAVGVEVGRGRR